MIIFNKNKINGIIRYVIPITALSLSLCSYACAGHKHATPQETATPNVPRTESSSDVPAIFGPEIFDIEFASPVISLPDEKQQSYINYMLSTINISNGEFRKAIENLEKVMVYDPDSAYLKKRMALLLNEINKPELALKYAEESIKINPEDIGTKTLLADLYSITGDNSSAIACYKEIISLEPENQRARMLFSTALARAGMLDEALEQLNILTGENPELFFAHYYKGKIYETMKKPELAEEEYRSVLSINEAMEPAYIDLAELYFMQGKLEEAADTYQGLLKIYPMNRLARERLIAIYELLGKKDDIALIMNELKLNTSPGDPSRQAIGLYHLQKGNLAESIQELGLIVSTWPGDQKSRYYLAIAYAQNDQSEEALYHFRLIQEGNEFYINSRIHIAYLLNKMGKPDEAIGTIRKAIEYKRDEMDLYSLLASIYESNDDFLNAREVIYEGLKVDENNIELLFRLGVILEKEGDIEGLINQMKKVLELDPENADALNYIGYTYAESGINLDEALDMIQRALKIKPDNGYYIDSLGWVYYQQGNYQNALDALKKAFSLVSEEDPTIAEHLGDVYFKINRYEKSLEMYEKALSLNHQSSDKILKKIEDVKKLLE
ncbi:MAG: tetratricopeptide repeat protein [Deltaproteobacteria bacterium]|nr:tetratricopeptide repeat protein [Deltaproteobacteria bacterium]